MASKKVSGVSLRGGLPENNGLGPAAQDIVDNPTTDIVVVMRLNCDDIVNHVQAGTKTAVLNIAEVEVMSDERDTAARGLLNDRRAERRSEERAREEAERVERGELTLDEAEATEGGDERAVETVELPNGDGSAFGDKEPETPTGSRKRK